MSKNYSTQANKVLIKILQVYLLLSIIITSIIIIIIIIIIITIITAIIKSDDLIYRTTKQHWQIS